MYLGNKIKGRLGFRASPSGRSARKRELNRVGENQHITTCSRIASRIPIGSGFAPLRRGAHPHCPRQRTRIYPSRGLALSARATSQAENVTRNPPKKDRGRAPSMARSAKNELILKKDECIECY